MDNFSDFFHHLAAKQIIVHNLIAKNVNLHILFLFLFLPPTLAFDCKCSLNNESKNKGLKYIFLAWQRTVWSCNQNILCLDIYTEN